jgi:hypothetical protein
MKMKTKIKPMNTLHFIIDNGVLKVIAELPKEPKRFEAGDSLTYNEAAWQVYNEALQKAKQEAIEVVNQDEVKIFIVEKYWSNKNQNFVIKPDTIYSLACKIEVIDDVPSSSAYVFSGKAVGLMSINPETKDLKITPFKKVALISFSEPTQKEESQEQLIDEIVVGATLLGRTAMANKFTITRKAPSL